MNLIFYNHKKRNVFLFYYVSLQVTQYPRKLLEEALRTLRISDELTPWTSKVFHEKPQSIQYNAALAVTGAVRGSSSEKLYQELGLESRIDDGSEDFANSIKF